MARKDKRQQILRAAERLFTSRRFHEVTVSDIARVAQVGKGTIYQYFADKNDLFFQMATSGFDELCEMLRRRVPDRAPFAEQLLDACQAIDAFFESRHRFRRVMHSEEGRMLWRKGNLRELWKEKHRKLDATVAEIIRKGVAEGAIRSDISAEVLAVFLLGMLGTRARALEEGTESMRELEAVVDLFCSGAGRPGVAVAPAEAAAQESRGS